MAGEGLGTGLSAWRDFHYVGHAELRKGEEDDVGNEGEGQEVEDDERGGWDACIVVSSCKQGDGRALPAMTPTWARETAAHRRMTKRDRHLPATGRR